MCRIRHLGDRRKRIITTGEFANHHRAIGMLVWRQPDLERLSRVTTDSPRAFEDRDHVLTCAGNVDVQLVLTSPLHRVDSQCRCPIRNPEKPSRLLPSILPEVGDWSAEYLRVLDTGHYRKWNDEVSLGLVWRVVLHDDRAAFLVVFA